MYLPQHFEESRVSELHRIVRENALGALITNGVSGLDANHLPFEFHPGNGAPGHLLGHVARANPLWQQVRDGDSVMVIFRAADAYISPNWYPSKHELHRQVPTWNYQVVHVHGRIYVRDDEKFVRGVVARLTREHETRVQESKPWKMGNAPRAYIDSMIASIVGIEVRIERLVGKSKLSQNREARDRQNAAQVLNQRGDIALAHAMTNAAPSDA